MLEWLHRFQFYSEFCEVATLKMEAACFCETYVADRRSAWCRSPPDHIQSGGCLSRPSSNRWFHNTALSHLISSDWDKPRYWAITRRLLTHFSHWSGWWHKRLGRRFTRCRGVPGLNINLAMCVVLTDLYTWAKRGVIRLATWLPCCYVWFWIEFCCWGNTNW